MKEGEKGKDETSPSDELDCIEKQSRRIGIQSIKLMQTSNDTHRLYQQQSLISLQYKKIFTKEKLEEEQEEVREAVGDSGHFQSIMFYLIHSQATDKFSRSL